MSLLGKGKKISKPISYKYHVENTLSNFKRVFLEIIFSITAGSRTRVIFIRLTCALACSFFDRFSREVHTIVKIDKKLHFL